MTNPDNDLDEIRFECLFCHAPLKLSPKDKKQILAWHHKEVKAAVREALADELTELDYLISDMDDWDRSQIIEAIQDRLKSLEQEGPEK